MRVRPVPILLVGVLLALNAACAARDDVEATAGTTDAPTVTADPGPASRVFTGVLLQPSEGRTLMCTGMPDSALPTCTQFAEVRLGKSVEVDWHAKQAGPALVRYTDPISIEFAYSDGGIEILGAQPAVETDGSPLVPSVQNPDQVDPAAFADYKGMAPEEINLQLYEQIKAAGSKRGIDLTGLFSVSMGTLPATVVRVLADTPAVTDLLDAELASYRYHLVVLSRAGN